MSRPISISSALTFIPSSYDTTNYSYSGVTNMSNGYADSASTTYAQINLKTGSNAETYVYWIFDTSSIPEGATIDSVTCSAKVLINNTQSNRINTREAQLYAGTTAKGSAYTVANSTTAFSITAGTWTRSELQNARLRLYAKRGTSNTTNNYYFRFYGATLTVNYSLNGTEYEVSFDNQSSDATTDPSTSQYVLQGGSQEVKIYVDDKDDIVVKDNNTEVNSSLVEHQASNNEAEVIPVAGASYGFTLDTSDNYYKSQNAGHASSVAICRVSISASTNCTLTIRYVNYAEGTYDYGIIGVLDTGLSATSTATTESSNWYWAGSASTDNTSTEKSIDIAVPSGNHFLDIKFRKDNYTDSNNDAFWFKYEVNPGQAPHYYSYTISNISADHAISIEDAVVGTTYGISASTTYAGATVSPATQEIGQGRTARIQIAVANLYEIVVKDNGTTVTNSLVQNSTGYTYTISNVQATHSVTVEEATNYSVTVTSTYAGATGTANPSKVYAGRDSNVEVEVDNLYEIVVKDNGNVVNLSQPIDTAGNYIPSEYDSVFSTHGGEYSSSYGTDNGLSNSASTTYARVYLNTGAQAESRLSYAFDCSSIPQNARITSVACVVRAYCNGSTTYVPTRQAQLYHGTTAKGTAGTLGTSNGTINVAGGTWTRDELDDIKIVARCVRGNSNTTTSYYLYFYGATLTVEYEVPATYTLTNVQTNHAITIEEAPYYSMTTACTYANAALSVSPDKVYQGQTTSVTVTLSVANKYEVVVRDGNTDITSAFTGSNGTYTYTVNNVNSAHAFSVEEAPYYTVTVNNPYAGATITTDPAKGYYGIDVNVRIEVADIDEIQLFDNGTNVSASIINVGSGVYRYTINAINGNHTISVVESEKYDITATSNYSAVTISPASASVVEGHSKTFTIEGDEDTDLEADIVLLDNNVNVTSQMTRAMGETGTTSTSLGTFDADNSEYVGIYNNYEYTRAEGKSCEEGIGTASGNTRSSFYPATGAGSELVVFYNFGAITGLPENATITNVSCDAAVAAAYFGSGYTEMNVQLCIGTTPVGTATPITTSTTSATTHNIDGGSGWTVNDLSNAKIRMYGVRNDTNSNNDATGVRDNLNMCGASLIVTYSLPGGYLYTVSNVQEDHTLVVNEVPATYYTVTASSNYQDATITPASASVRQNHTTKFQISASSIYDIVVKDNGVNVTSQLVANETGFTYTTGRIAEQHTIVVEESESFDINTSSEYQDATITPATQSVKQGMSAITYIEVGSLSEISVKDNGVEVGDQLVLVSAGTTYEATGVLDTFDDTNSQYVGIYSSYVATNAEGHTSAEGMASSASTRSAFYPATGAGSELFVYYDFGDVSGIPQGSIITNVSAVVAMSTAYSGQGYSDIHVQLCKGTTPVGEPTSPPFGGSGVTNATAAAQLVNVDGGSGWTLSDIANAKVLLYGMRNSTNSNNDSTGSRDNLCMHGADLVVTYSDGNTFNGFTYTLQNIQTGHTIVITENEQYTVSAETNVQDVTITPSSVTVYGRESVTLTIDGDLTDLVVEDNGIDVTTQLRTVNATSHTYTIARVTEHHTITVAEPGVEADYIKVAGEYKRIRGFYKKVNGVWTLVQKSAFESEVSSKIVIYGGVVENVVIGEAEVSGGAIAININDDALESGTYKMVYENANKEPLSGFTDITEFTIS